MLPDPDERQVAPTIEGIRKDHTARYMWACPYVRNKSVVDYGCGVGYGSAIMATAAALVTGIDADEAAIAYAEQHYTSTGAGFARADILARDHWASGVAVAFEVIEHIEAPDKFLADVNADLLLASVPNEHVFPYDPRIKHHHRHYTPEQFEQLLNDCGWQVLEWWGQAGPESMPVANTQGRTQLVVAERSATPKGGTWKTLPPPPSVVYVPSVPWRHPTGKAPKTVMLCGLGPSKYELTEAMVRHDFRPVWDELWVINKGIDFLPQADVAWIMDDVYDYATRHPAYGEGMQRFGGQIIGQTTLPNDGGIPFTEYPLEAVLNFWGMSAANWLHTISVGYTLAYAGFIGVERLMLAGIDLSWPNRPDLSEAGNAVVCYWIGRLESMGCAVEINSDSTLNNTRNHGRYEWRQFYGYLRQPLLERA